jgi:RNA polymerase sigma-54 factor
LRETDDDWRDRSILDNRTSSWTTEDEERRQWLYDSMVAPVTLQQHLQQQLDLSLVEPDSRVRRQNPAGRPRRTRVLRHPAARPRQPHGHPPKNAESRARPHPILRPSRRGSHQDWPTHCASNSTARASANSIEGRIVANHLEDLARKRFPQIAKALGTSIDRITEAACCTSAGSTPTPAAISTPTGNPYIQPDVIIEADDNGHLSARLSGENISATPHQ